MMVLSGFCMGLSIRFAIAAEWEAAFYWLGTSAVLVLLDVRVALRWIHETLQKGER